MPPTLVKPAKPVLESFVPTGRKVPVGDRQSWISIAKSEGMDPWDLIDHNFPGIKAKKSADFQAATRDVNWYLHEYVGCTAHDGANYSFSKGLKGGRGAWKGGFIFIPTSKPPPAPVHTCERIEVPPVSILPWPVQAALLALGARWPTQARCLHETEIKTAENVYGSSLAWEDIYVSDGVGASSRAVTIAVPLGNRWIVVLNMGGHAHKYANSLVLTLIHELAHAWQSQHHPQPYQFMVNCAESQARAAAHTVIANAQNHPVGGGLLRGVGIPNLGLSEASAYAYVPDKTFGDYGGEQIAQQIEDSVNPMGPRDAAVRAHLFKLRMRISGAPQRAADPENVRSLSTFRFEQKEAPRVVWPRD